MLGRNTNLRSRLSRLILYLSLTVPYDRHIGQSDRPTMKLFAMSLRILWTCIKEAPEVASRRRRRSQEHG